MTFVHISISEISRKIFIELASLRSLVTDVESVGRGPASLDVVCWALGMPSPKEVMDGSMVSTYFAKGDVATIAEYNAGDVRATTAVYQRVRDGLLRFRDDW